MTEQAMKGTGETRQDDAGHGTTRQQDEPTSDGVSIEATGLFGDGSWSEDRSGAKARSAGDQGARACSYAIPANTTDSGGKC